MNCDIVLVGLNHRTAGVDVRERFALVDFCAPDTWAVPCKGNINEALILSTCNRVELLATGSGDTAGQLLHSWAAARGADVDELRNYVYIHKNLDAVRHLFTVASSLDSMVLGEPQILGQLKGAYRKAVAAHSVGVILNRLLHKAFSVAKRVRTETAVASSAVSISYAAVELAKRIFGDMHEHSAMLVGAGEMAELAATHLLMNGHRKLALLQTEPDFRVVRERISGFLKCAEAYRLPVELLNPGIRSGENSPAKSYEFFSAYLDANPEPPFTGLFTVSEDPTREVLRAIREHRLSVPGDLSVISLEHSVTPAIPGLTSVNSRRDKIAHCAIQAIRAHFDHTPGIPFACKITPEIHHGATVKNLNLN